MEVVNPVGELWTYPLLKTEFAMVKTLVFPSPLVFPFRIKVPGLLPSRNDQNRGASCPVVHGEIESADDEYVLFIDVDTSDVPSARGVHVDSLLKFRLLDIVKERRLCAGYQQRPPCESERSAAFRNL